VKEERQKAAHVLLLDAGNALFGPHSTEGKVIVGAMNLLDYDAVALGDQDFNLGLETLRQRMAEAEFPILSANATLAATGELLAKPYAIKEIGEHKAAIIGLTSPKAARTPGGKGIAILDPIETAHHYLAEVGGEADIIIVLSNLGLDKDKRLASEVEGIDLIVGGNSQVILDPPLRIESTGTIIVQAGYRGEWVGEVELSIDEGGTVTSHEGKIVLLGPDFADDPEMKAFLDAYK